MKHYVNITLETDEMDLTAAESKATYDEIRGWIQEKYGFHVTNLNIAQVKRKNGIIERENYNKLTFSARGWIYVRMGRIL